MTEIGDADVHRAEDGTTYVTRADPIIRVSLDLLAELDTAHYDPATQTLTLDTAATYVYDHLRPDPDDPERWAIFRRRQVNEAATARRRSHRYLAAAGLLVALDFDWHYLWPETYTAIITLPLIYCLASMSEAAGFARGWKARDRTGRTQP